MGNTLEIYSAFAAVERDVDGSKSIRVRGIMPKMEWSVVRLVRRDNSLC